MKIVDFDSYTEILNELNQLESNQRLYELKIRDVPIWDRVRNQVLQSILQRKGLMPGPQINDNHSIRRQIGSVVRAISSFLTKNPLRAGDADRLYWGHERRKRMKDGYWWDIYTDPIHQHERVPFVHLEAPSIDGHRTPTRTADIYHLDFLYILFGLTRLIPVLNVNLTDAEQAQIREVETRLEQVFDVRVDLGRTVEVQLTRRLIARPIFQWILNRVAPDVTIITVGDFKKDYIEVCQEMDIPVIELQHGGGLPTHPDRTRPNARLKGTFPDYYFVFGEFWRDHGEYPVPSERVVSVGYPHLEQQQKKFTDTTHTGSVLFVSQPTIGHELSRFAVEYAEDDCDHEVIFKLHPASSVRWRTEYPWLVDAPLTVVGGEDPSLYELLSSSSVLVGVYSTVIYEGVMFDLDPYLVDLPGVSRMKHLVADGVAQIVKSPEDLREHIQSSNSEGVIEKDYYFKSNALDSIVSALEEIQKEQDDNN